MLQLTSNQIAYWNLKETERANRAKEQENVRHNTAQEYNQLIGALDNVFSLGAHAAKGSPDLQEGSKSQTESFFGDTPITKVLEGVQQGISNPTSIFQMGSEPIVTPIGTATKTTNWLSNIADKLKDLLMLPTSIFNN